MNQGDYRIYRYPCDQKQMLSHFAIFHNMEFFSLVLPWWVPSAVNSLVATVFAIPYIILSVIMALATKSFVRKFSEPLPITTSRNQQSSTEPTSESWFWIKLILLLGCIFLCGTTLIYEMLYFRTLYVEEVIVFKKANETHAWCEANKGLPQRHLPGTSADCKDAAFKLESSSPTLEAMNRSISRWPTGPKTITLIADHWILIVVGIGIFTLVYFYFPSTSQQLQTQLEWYRVKQML
jgi:hypothetical protein